MIQGIDQNTQISQRVPFDIEALYRNYQQGGKLPFPNAYLTKVEVTPTVRKEHKLLPDVKLGPNEKPTVEQVTPESIRHILNFNFMSPDGIQEYREQIWPIEDDDPKAFNKNRMLNQRIGQLYECYMGANTAAGDLNIKNVLGKLESNYKNYFEGMARIFNTAKEGGTPVFLEGENKIPVRIKLTRNRSNAKNPNEIKMPLGNVIERYVKDAKSSTLVLNGDDAFDVIEKPKATANLGNAGGGFGPVTDKKEAGWDNVDEEL